MFESPDIHAHQTSRSKNVPYQSLSTVNSRPRSLLAMCGAIANDPRPHLKVKTALIQFVTF